MLDEAMVKATVRQPAGSPSIKFNEMFTPVGWLSVGTDDGSLGEFIQVVVSSVFSFFAISIHVIDRCS